MTSARLIEIPSWGTVSLLEALWLLTGVATLTFSAPWLRVQVRYWRRACEERDPLLITIAWGYVRREILRTSKGATITAIGVYGCVSDSGRPGPVVTTVAGFVLTAGLILIGVLVAFGAIGDRRQQRTEDRQIAESVWNGETSHRTEGATP